LRLAGLFGGFTAGFRWHVIGVDCGVSLST
jgi:hypothetical protein